MNSQTIADSDKNMQFEVPQSRFKRHWLEWSKSHSVLNGLELVSIVEI